MPRSCMSTPYFKTAIYMSTADIYLHVHVSTSEIYAQCNIDNIQAYITELAGNMISDAQPNPNIM